MIIQDEDSNITPSSTVSLRFRNVCGEYLRIKYRICTLSKIYTHVKTVLDRPLLVVYSHHLLELDFAYLTFKFHIHFCVGLQISISSSSITFPFDEYVALLSNRSRLAVGCQPPVDFAYDVPVSSPSPGIFSSSIALDFAIISRVLKLSFCTRASISTSSGLPRPYFHRSASLTHISRSMTACGPA